MEAACNKEGVYSSPLPPRATSRQELVKVGNAAASLTRQHTCMEFCMESLAPDDVRRYLVREQGVMIICSMLYMSLRLRGCGG